MEILNLLVGFTLLAITVIGGYQLVTFVLRNQQSIDHDRHKVDMINRHSQYERTPKRRRNKQF